MKYPVRSILLCLFVFFILGGCITRVDEALPYAELPEIIVATEIRLVASPSHPSAYLPVEPIAVGTHVQVVGRDTDAAWLLVLHNNILGWMPTFFSRDNVATLNTAITFEPLSDKCTNYLDTTFGLDTTWNSTAEGSVIAFGTLYRPNTPAQAGNSSLTIQVDGTGQAFESDYVYTALTDTSSLVLFAFEISNLEKGSQISFLLNDADNKPFFFEALFFSDNCTKSTRFKDRLPVGKPRSVANQTAPQPQQTVQPVETLQPESTTIVHTSDARTPTPKPTPTPFPTLDAEIYGVLLPISMTIASSVFKTGSFPESNTVDGNIETVWSSNFDDDIGAWIDFRLAKPTKITGIRIYSLGVRGGRGQPKKITLLFSDNSQQTVSLNNVEGWNNAILTPVTSDNIRLNIDEVHDFSVFNTTQIPEVQVLGELEAPVLVESSQLGVSIRLRSSQVIADLQSTGHSKMSFLLNSGEPFLQATMNIFSLEEDVAGDLLRMDAAIQNQPPNENGFYIAEFSPQQYLLTLNMPDQGAEPIVPGWYSDANYSEADKENYRGIIFPVEAGKTTEIIVQFSQLIVGVIDENGKAIRGSEYPDWKVMVCADMLAEVADDALRCANNLIDRRGAAAFQLAPGEYHIRVMKDVSCYWEFPVAIDLKESKQEIVAINSKQSDGCVGDKQ